MKTYAFTLVELIVVITILAILGTIAFVSFQGYTKTARDTVRISDLKLIQKSLEFELTKNDYAPYPTDYITITASGTILGYQGYAGREALGKVGISDAIVDPSDQTQYSYVTNRARTKFQLLGFLEVDGARSPFMQTYADTSNRFPLLRGSELGILFDSVSSQPAQNLGLDIDVENTSNSYKLFLNNNDTIKSGSGLFLTSGLNHRIYPDGSCLSILKNGNSLGDGIYSIYPHGGIPFNVYCDMTSQRGGWIVFETLTDQNIGGAQDILSKINMTEVNLDTGYDRDILFYNNPENLNTISEIVNEALDQKYKALPQQKERFIYRGSIVFGGGRNTPFDAHTGSCGSTRFKAWIFTTASTKGTYCGYSYSAAGRKYILNNAYFDSYSNDYFLGYSKEGPSYPGTCRYNNITLNYTDCLDKYGVKKVLIR